MVDNIHFSGHIGNVYSKNGKEYKKFHSKHFWDNSMLTKFLAGRSMPGAEALRLVFIGDFNQRVVGRQVIAGDSHPVKVSIVRF